MSFSSMCLSTINSCRNPYGMQESWENQFTYTPDGERYERIVFRDRTITLAPRWKVYIAEIGYLLVIPVAIVETILSLIVAAPFVCRSDLSFDHLTSSAFSILWAFGLAGINLFFKQVVFSEGEAREALLNRNPFIVYILPSSMDEASLTFWQ